MIAAVVLGMLLGVWAGGVAAIMRSGSLTRVDVYARLIGGVLGGMLAAVAQPPGDISASALMLIALAGYVGADMIAAVAAPRRQ